ncbi:MAG: hypothetical protein RL068_117 [Actinomycetota bacterium]|jgi:AcrR family transcriptional regulator
MTTRQSPGRPRSSSRNRQEQIQKAASKLFADLGYDKTTIRLVAEAADVDPKLVMHYFGNKQKLFMSTVKVPTEVGAALTLLKLTPRASWGKRMADVIWLAQKSGAFQTLVGIIRASSSEPEAAAMFKEFYLENMLVPMVHQLEVDNKELRAIMMSSLMSGYVFTKEIVGVSDLSKAKDKQQRQLFAAMLQTILTTKL